MFAGPGLSASVGEADVPDGFGILMNVRGERRELALFASRALFLRPLPFVLFPLPFGKCIALVGDKNLSVEKKRWCVNLF